MSTIYDWISVAIFAAIVVIFMQRSIGPRPDWDRMVNYLPPSLGCALGNYLGNEGYDLVAVAVLVLVVVYIVKVIRPGAKF